MNEEQKNKVAQEVEQEAVAAWKDLYHNATITSKLPDMNEYEQRLFDDCIADHVKDLCDGLTEMVKEEHGYTWTFYQYGRGGRTIAPHEPMGSSYCGGFGGVRPEFIEVEVCPDDKEFSENVEAVKKFTAAIKAVNEQVKLECSVLGQWWEGMKEANDWNGDIAEHDGKVPRFVTIWVCEKCHYQTCRCGEGANG